MIVLQSLGRSPAGCGKLATFHVVAGDNISGTRSFLAPRPEGRWKIPFIFFSASLRLCVRYLCPKALFAKRTQFPHLRSIFVSLCLGGKEILAHLDLIKAQSTVIKGNQALSSLIKLSARKNFFYQKPKFPCKTLVFIPKMTAKTYEKKLNSVRNLPFLIFNWPLPPTLGKYRLIPPNTAPLPPEIFSMFVPPD
jgi:hypothetical protein